MFPGKIQNKTNGVTPRRWIHSCNRELSDLISEQIGSHDEWVINLSLVRSLSEFKGDAGFQEKFMRMKANCKRKL